MDDSLDRLVLGFCFKPEVIITEHFSLRHISAALIFEIIPPLVDTDMTKGRGKDKLTPEALVKQFIKAYQADRYEINIGKTKLLRIIQRISPAIADRILKNN